MDGISLNIMLAKQACFFLDGPFYGVDPHVTQKKLKQHDSDKVDFLPCHHDKQGREYGLILNQIFK